MEINDLTLQPGARVTIALLEVQERSEDGARVTDHAMSASLSQVIHC